VVKQTEQYKINRLQAVQTERQREQVLTAEKVDTVKQRTQDNS